MKHAQNKKGFSLIEVTTATVIFIMAIGMAVSGYMFTLKNTTQGDVQDNLDMDVRIALESLKMDLRLSSLNQIHYYPEGPGPYQALSFPKAYDSDGDGIIEKDENGNIIWDETVVYHIRPTTPNQLVKTTFNPRDNTLTDAERQIQLENVVINGVGTSAANGSNARSHALFQNLLNWKIIPQAGQYDAYSPVAEQDILSLGYSLLAGGVHDFEIKVIGKNSSSSGHKVSLDRITFSSPNIEREAEGLTVISQNGATSAPEYRPDDASGNYYLTFPASSAESSFTLSVDTDRWVETNFRGGAQKEVELNDTSIVFDETLSPKDYVVTLKGNDLSWEAALQTGTPQPADPVPGKMKNWVVRIMQKGSELADNGNWFAYNGLRCQLAFNAASNGRLQIDDVYIGEVADPADSVLDFDIATIHSVTFNGDRRSPVIESSQSVVSDWIDMPIDKEKNYLVSFRIIDSDDKCHPAIWTDIRGSVAKTCMAVTNNLAAAIPIGSWKFSYDKVAFPAIFGLSNIKVTYPERGHYVSQVFDTAIASPTYNDISWNAELPPDTKLAFKVRTGNNPDLSDALDWRDISSFNSSKSISAAFKRYIQFMAILSSSGDGLSTPILKDVSIDWDAPPRMINVGGIIAKGPDHGQIEITVDGNPLRSALIVDLEIYKDIYSMKGASRRISSRMKVDVTPRNTSL